jgi:hypothetical protein|tara:strand:+ start:150 stop:305 length:156 start_codon:yes stop_codon:yes gene_type:complete
LNKPSELISEIKSTTATGEETVRNSLIMNFLGVDDSKSLLKKVKKDRKEFI